jgi:hypothetical protein
MAMIAHPALAAPARCQTQAEAHQGLVKSSFIAATIDYWLTGGLADWLFEAAKDSIPLGRLLVLRTIPPSSSTVFPSILPRECL